MSVKVAVRVRPYNQRERDLGAKCCVYMKGATTKIRDPHPESNKEAERTFTFDYSLWSHDDFVNDDEGYSHKASADSNYATQKLVYDELGQ